MTTTHTPNWSFWVTLDPGAPDPVYDLSRGGYASEEAAERAMRNAAEARGHKILSFDFGSERTR